MLRRLIAMHAQGMQIAGLGNNRCTVAFCSCALRSCDLHGGTWTALRSSAKPQLFVSHAVLPADEFSLWTFVATLRWP